MKKAFKITGIALVIFALVSNFHAAIFTFYGIKTNNLSGQVWAQSTSTSGDDTSGGGTGGDDTSGGGTGGDDTSGGGTGGGGTSTSGDADVFGNPVYSTITCGVVTWEKTVFYGVSGEIVGTIYIENGVVKTSYSGQYTSKTTTSGTIAARDVTYISDCPGIWGFCTQKTAVEACQ